MSLIPLWKATWDRFKGRCSICDISEAEGDLLGVFSIFQERPIDPNTFHPEEFVVFCVSCRTAIHQHFTEGICSFGVMRKYFRLRGEITEKINNERKEREDSRSPQAPSRRRRK